MAITINWGTRVIFIPRNDLTLIQLTPTEIRELNLNEFRMTLKDLEDSEDGMCFPDTHRHNTEVSIAGLVIARVIEIINGYTITFEDGQYAVNLVGANSNVGDVVNVNQVSIRSQNSAGLISNMTIEYASYQECVTIDITSPWTGTLHPVGTGQKPVNNIADAKLIAAARGFQAFRILSSMDGTTDLSDYIVSGIPRSVVLNMLPHTCQSGCRFRTLTLTGQMCGQVCTFDECDLHNLSKVQGTIYNSTIAGVITLTGSNTNIIDCASGRTIEYGRTVIDLDSDPKNLQVRRFSGGLILRNFTFPDNRVVLDFDSGALEIDPSCTDGTIVVHGETTILDNGGPRLIRDFSAAISPESVADRTRVELSPELAEISKVKAFIVNRLRVNKTTGAWTVYDVSGNIPLFTGIISDDGTFKDRVPT